MTNSNICASVFQTSLHTGHHIKDSLGDDKQGLTMFIRVYVSKICVKKGVMPHPGCIVLYMNLAQQVLTVNVARQVSTVGLAR